MLYQVNRILFKRLSLNSFRRNKTSGSPIYKVLYPLENRKLIKVSGNDAPVFLQGLMTNDMRHFEEGAKSIYAMFLNNKGRVLYDTLIHQWDCQTTFLIECDQDVLNQLKKHLNLFKLKRLVKVEDINENYKVWVLVSTNMLPNMTEHKLHIYKDPRLSDLGFRIIAESSLNGLEIAGAVGTDISVENDSVGYKYLRYKLGVSEGAEDLPPGSTFPLEVNCDYLHGVSFHKGCYIGQELTARVHHTGVVRKRIMPLKFLDVINEPIDKDIVLIAPDKPKSNLGKLKGYVNDCGIGLVRIKEVLETRVLNVGKFSVEILKPNWWPIEAPKEKSNIIKMD